MPGIKHRTRVAGTKINVSAVWGEDHEIEGGAIGTAEVADGSVTTAKVADGSVTTAKVADGSVTTAKVADGSVTTAKVADAAITSAKIAADTVIAGDIAAGGVGTSELADNAVVTAKIAAGQVTTPKMNFDNEFTNIGILERYFTRQSTSQIAICHRRAIHYNNKTYINYQGDPPTFDPLVIVFDHNKQTWTLEYKAGTNPLSNNYHGTPGMVIDALGYIHVFYGTHGSSPGYISHARSTNPEDISSWIDKPNLTGMYTYPALVKAADGTLYLFLRLTSLVTGGQTSPEVFRKSTDNGETWTAHTIIIDAGPAGVFPNDPRIYHQDFAYDSVNSRIWLSWMFWDADDTVDHQRRLYVAYLNLVDGLMYSPAGTSLGASIDLAEANANCTAFDGGAINTVHMHAAGSLRLLSTGYPVALFINPWVVAADRRAKLSKWDGTAWTAPVTLANVEANAYVNDCLRMIDDVNFEAYVGVRHPFIDTYGITKFITSDGGSTWQVKQIIISGNPGINHAWVVKNGLDELKIVISCEAHFAGVENYDRKVPMWAWGENGFVYRRFKW